MKASVCIPVFNAAPWIAEAIDSVLAQTHQDFEICVWDDGSTDGTGGIVRKMQFGDPRIHLDGSKENRGIAHGLNGAASMAATERIVFMGADDILKPTYLERVLPVLDAEYAGMASALPEQFGEKRFGEMMMPKNMDRFALKQRFYFGNYLYGGVAFRKEVFDELGGFDQAYDCTCDLELFIRLLAKYEIRVVEEVLYRYRVRVGSASNSGDVKKDNAKHTAQMNEIHRKYYRWRSIDGQLSKAA